MERPVSFNVTDYHPDGDEWSNDLVSRSESRTGLSSPIHQVQEMENSKEKMEYVTITLDVHEDEAALIVTPGGNGGSSVEKKPAVVRPAFEPRRPKFEALKGLTLIIDMTDNDWIAVERRFKMMTAKTEGLLHRSKFGECVGINSEEFALELFDTLATRWNRNTGEVISMEELREFWSEINDKNFDSRLHLFSDMVDKDCIGRLTQHKLREFIRLAASANNQSTMQEMADEYAALIMEEFDPDDLGYIPIETLVPLLDVESLSKITITEETKKPTKRWNKVCSLFPCLKKIISTKKI